MKQLIDQSAHFAIAFLIALLVASHTWGGLLIGFAMGLVREVTEEGDLSIPNLKAALGSWLDLGFWALGGALGGSL